MRQYLLLLLFVRITAVDATPTSGALSDVDDNDDPPTVAQVVTFDSVGSKSSSGGVGSKSSSSNDEDNFMCRAERLYYEEIMYERRVQYRTRLGLNPHDTSDEDEVNEAVLRYNNRNSNNNNNNNENNENNASAIVSNNIRNANNTNNASKNSNPRRRGRRPRRPDPDTAYDRTNRWRYGLHSFTDDDNDNNSDDSGSTVSVTDSGSAASWGYRSSFKMCRGRPWSTDDDDNDDDDDDD